MQIGTVELGRRPVVVVALSDKNLKVYLERARKLRIDLVEARIDLLEFLDWQEFLDTVADFGFYTVSTLRPVWEGGKLEIPEVERLKLFEKVICHPATGAIDIELRAEILSEVVSFAREQGKKVIVSYHDFEKTPEREEIEDILERAALAGADIVKVAFTGRSEKDTTRVCCTLSEFKGNKVFMVMGEVGSFTRVVGYSFGSLMTYTFFGKPVAPGQIEAEHLVYLLCQFYPEYRKEKVKFLKGELFKMV